MNYWITDKEIDAFKARIAELERINSQICSDKAALLVDGSKWQARAETAERIIAAAQAAPDAVEAACVAYTDAFYPDMADALAAANLHNMKK